MEGPVRNSGSVMEIHCVFLKSLINVRKSTVIFKHLIYKVNDGPWILSFWKLVPVIHIWDGMYNSCHRWRTRKYTKYRNIFYLSYAAKIDENSFRYIWPWPYWYSKSKKIEKYLPVLKTALLKHSVTSHQYLHTLTSSNFALH